MVVMRMMRLMGRNPLPNGTLARLVAVLDGPSTLQYLLVEYSPKGPVEKALGTFTGTVTGQRCCPPKASPRESRVGFLPT